MHVKGRGKQPAGWPRTPSLSPPFVVGVTFTFLFEGNRHEALVGTRTLTQPTRPASLNMTNPASLNMTLPHLFALSHCSHHVPYHVVIAYRFICLMLLSDITSCLATTMYPRNNTNNCVRKTLRGIMPSYAALALNRWKLHLRRRRRNE